MNPPTTTEHPAHTGFAAPAAPSLSLGVVGNCAFSALIDPHGRVVWSCLPRFDGDPVFHALLGSEDGAGAFAIDIEERREHACAHDRDCLHNTPPRSG